MKEAIRVIMGPEPVKERDNGEVHIKGVDGLHTLCGWCDSMTTWPETNKPVDCASCLLVFDYVKSLKIRRKKT